MAQCWRIAATYRRRSSGRSGCSTTPGAKTSNGSPTTSIAYGEPIRRRAETSRVPIGEGARTITASALAAACRTARRIAARRRRYCRGPT
ncbi:hypothetical protein [Plantactinospora veratri]